MTFTVDVSHHDWDRANGRLNWEATAQSGIVAACVRASYGDPHGYSPITRRFLDMATDARRAGLIVGAYHNLTRGDTNSIRRQVAWLMERIGTAGATWAMLDVERYPEMVSRSIEPRISDVRTFCTMWREYVDVPLFVYLPRWVWAGHLGSPELASLRCPLVSSDYGTNNSGSPASLYAGRNGDTGRGWQPYGGVTPTLWQFGSAAGVAGLTSKTDINAFRGTPEQLRALLQEDDMAITDEDAAKIAIAVAKGDTTPWDPSDSGYTIGGATRDGALGVRALQVQLTALRADVASALGRDTVDEQAIADAVLAALTPQAIADRVLAALPPTMAGQVAEEIARRLAE